MLDNTGKKIKHKTKKQLRNDARLIKKKTKKIGTNTGPLN